MTSHGDGDADDAEEFSLTQEQEDALALDRNIAITAGAGTGKTTTLTERYLHILESEGVGPEEIVTITFTNDAANELQDRIREAVGDRLTEASTEEYEYWRTVKDDLDDGFIHTIHGLCSRILREEVVDAPVTPEFEVYDETDATVLARRVVREYLTDQLDGGPRSDDVTRLAHLWSRSQLEDILVGLVDERPESETWCDRWHDQTPADYLDYVWDTIHPISPDLATDVFENPDVRAAFETIESLANGGLLGDVPPEDDAGADTVQTVSGLLETHRPLAEDATARDQQAFLDALCDYLTTQDGTRDGRDWMYWGASGRWENAGRASEQDQLQQAIETLFAEIPIEELDYGVDVDRASAHYVLALARILKDVLEAYQTRKDHNNVLDYDDLIETTISFLEDTPQLRQQLADQFSFVMVDEVQDTDPRQWELVRLLTSDDPDEFRAKNVFLVGDEKQSIYRFRGADVTSFASARQELEAANPGGAPTNLELSGNFRTTDETLAFCNDLFDGNRLFAPFGDEYAPYESRPQRLTPERPGGRDVTGTVEYLLVPDDDHDDLHAPGFLGATPEFVDPGDREAYALAARLTTLFDDPPEVYDEDAGETRAATPEDAAILLRSRGRLKAYERALDDYDIPYTVVSGTGYYDTPEITALLNLFRVLENPRDEVALYGVLRSPLFGFPDNTLANLRSSDDDLWAALGDASGDLEDAYQLLNRWRRMAGASPGTTGASPGTSPERAPGGIPDDSPGTPRGLTPESTTPWGAFLSKVIDDTGFMAAVAGDERPRQAVVNVNRFREQVRRWEEAGVKTIAELRSRLELRQDVEAHADEATIPEDTDGVELRTIHATKGLEYPIVVVPELGTKFNFQADVDGRGQVYFDDIDLEDTGDREPVLGLKSPTPEDAFAEQDTLVRRVTRERIRQHDRAELKRLLYVAMTRARDHILLSGIHDIKAGNNAYELAEANDPEAATSWRDWLQPILLGDDPVLDDLAQTGSYRGQLSESTYHVTRPPRPRPDWRRETDPEDVSVEIDIPVPDSPGKPRLFSATGFAKHQAANSQPGSGLMAEDPGRGTRDSRGLSATTVGTIVHRICETDLPRAEWRDFATNVGARYGETLTDEDVARIERHADCALAYLEDYTSGLDVLEQRHELSVTARLNGARIVGDIDHLLVTPDAYHIIDFKTNDLTDRTVVDLADYYQPQLDAYAVALHQADDDRAVETVLLFTDVDADSTTRYAPEELDDLTETLDTTL